MTASKATSQTASKPAANPTCFVIQSSQSQRIDRLYEEIFRVAIAEAELTPHRPAVDLSRPHEIEAVAAQMREAAACFADLTDESPYTWFALGCAVALGKPLCLVAPSSAPASLLAAWPSIIHYPALPLPSDYQRLQEEITSRLMLVPGRGEAAKAVASAVATAAVAGAPVPDAPLHNDVDVNTDESTGENSGELPPSAVETAVYEPIRLTVADIRVHELLALSIIARSTEPHGTTLRALALEMHKFGAAQATSLSINGLCRKRVVERRPMSIEDELGRHTEDCLFLTAPGRDWIESHHLNLSFTPPPLETEPEGLMDLIHAL